VEILRELGARVGQDVLAELIQRYIDEAPARLRAVAAAAEGGERSQARSLAHGLKGVSSNLGATAIASLLEGLERSLGEDVDVAPLLGGLAAELARTVEELRRVAAGGAG
jgi:HPt (histidine-containing phosphotransfer) domain-containing protein